MFLLRNSSFVRLRPTFSSARLACWQRPTAAASSSNTSPAFRPVLSDVRSLCVAQRGQSLLHISRTLGTSGHCSLCSNVPGDKENPSKPPTVVQRFKQMLKDYWYVLVPVHVATSVVWYGGFYLMCKSGVDVTAVLAWFGTSEQYLDKLRHSNLGYYALAYACYKVATPARYTVTLGGTSLSIKYLSDWGLLKTSSQVASNFKERTDIMKDRVEEEWIKAWLKFAKKRPPKKE